MGKGENFRHQLECQNNDNDDDMILVDKLDDAIIGHTDSWNGASWGRRKFIVGRPHRAVYDHDRSFKILAGSSGMSQEEAEQRFDEQHFDIDEEEPFDENGPIFVKVFKRRNRNLDRGKDLRSQFEEVMANLLYKVPVVDGFDDAIIGYTDSFMGMNYNMELLDESDIVGRPIRLVYDRDRCIEILKRKHGTKRNKAEENLESDESEYLGASTPVFVTLLKRRKTYDMHYNVKSASK